MSDGRAANQAHVRNFAELFAAAVTSVEVNVPDAHDLFMSEAREISFAVHVGDERFGLDRGEVLSRGPARANPQLQVEPGTLGALVDGRVSLTDALATGDLDLVGEVAEVAAIDRVLQVLVHGIVRSPDAPVLMHQLKSLTATTRADLPS